MPASSLDIFSLMQFFWQNYVYPLLTNPFFQIYLAAWTLISISWWAFRAERFGVTGLPFYIIYRTARLNKWIEKISNSSPRAWRIFWNIGVVTVLGAMALILYFLANNLFNLLYRTEQAASIQPIVPVPGLFVSFETFPYLVFALAVVLVTHELSHGIASLADRVPLKSTGMFFGHVLVGGFVEPDEEKLNQARNSTKLRIFAAGSFTNLVLGIFCLVLLVNFSATIAPFYNVVSLGVVIGSTPENLPASASGLRAGDVVTSINGTRISNISDLRLYMARVSPGQGVALETQRGAFFVRTTAEQGNSSHAVIGIGSLTDNVIYKAKFLGFSSEFPPILFHVEFWLQLVLISVGLINMLPMPPFDGDKFLETALKIFGLKRMKEIRTLASSAALSILLLNMILSGLRFGFLRV